MSEEESELKYHYFVSYSHTRGHGNLRISRSEKVRSMDCVNRMEELIGDDFRVDSPIILNYIQLDE